MNVSSNRWFLFLSFNKLAFWHNRNQIKWLGPGLFRNGFSDQQTDENNYKMLVRCGICIGEWPIYGRFSGLFKRKVWYVLVEANVRGIVSHWRLKKKNHGIFESMQTALNSRCLLGFFFLCKKPMGYDETEEFNNDRFYSVMLCCSGHSDFHSDAWISVFGYESILFDFHRRCQANVHEIWPNKPYSAQKEFHWNDLFASKEFGVRNDLNSQFFWLFVQNRFKIFRLLTDYGLIMNAGIFVVNTFNLICMCTILFQVKDVSNMSSFRTFLLSISA